MGNSNNIKPNLLKKSKLNLFLNFFIAISTFSCQSDYPGKVITEKRVKNGGIQTIVYPDTFENVESYSIYLKALKCSRKEDYKCSKKLLNEALIIDPSNDVICNSIGINEMRLYNYEKAAEYFKKAIELNDKYYRAYCNLGMNYYYDKKYLEGVRILKQVPADSIGQITRGSLYFHLLMNYTKLEHCDSAYHYYNLIQEFAQNEIFLENVEMFKDEELYKNCPQH